MRNPTARPNHCRTEKRPDRAFGGPVRCGGSFPSVFWLS
jgi:hypothetical protein